MKKPAAKSHEEQRPANIGASRSNVMEEQFVSFFSFFCLRIARIARIVFLSHQSAGLHAPTSVDSACGPGRQEERIGHDSKRTSPAEPSI